MRKKGRLRIKIIIASLVTEYLSMVFFTQFIFISLKYFLLLTKNTLVIIPLCVFCYWKAGVNDFIIC